MILVTGGTGFVGQEVVRELLARGHRVRLLVRDLQRAHRHEDDSRIELACGDVLRPETLPAAVRGVTTVIHLVGIIAETSRVTFEQAHFEATRNLLAAAKEAGVARWIQMSAAGTRPHAASRYHQTKWRAEELVRQSGLDWTIFQPSLVYGCDERDRLINLMRRVLTWPVDFFTLYSFPLLDGGRPLIQPVSVREVAHCFAAAPANQESIGRTFELVGPAAFSWREMALKVAAALGKTAIYEEVPIFLFLRVVLGLAIVALPVAIVLGSLSGALPLAAAEILGGLWVLLLLIPWRWRHIIVFGVPASPLLIAGEGLNAVAPRDLQCSEQLKMAVEDNIGDPRPAAETFHYEPEPFETGLARLIHR